MIVVDFSHCFFFDLLVFRSVLFNFHRSLNFQNFVLIVSSFIPLWLETIFLWFQSFKICWDLMCEIMCSILKKCSMCIWERVCILLFWSGWIVCICLLGTVDLQCQVLIDILLSCSIFESGVMMSPTIVVELPVSFFSSFSFCFYFGPLVKYIYFIIKSQRFV